MLRELSETGKHAPSHGQSQLKRLVLIYYVVAASCFALATPVFEAPDEPYHLDHVNYLIRNRSLPNQLDPDRRVEREGHQPPLYYIAGACVGSVLNGGRPIETALNTNPLHKEHGGPREDVAFYEHGSEMAFAQWSDQIAFFGLRFVGVLFGLLHLIFIIRISRLLGLGDAWAIAPVLFVATLPQYLFNTATINNDNLAMMLSSMTIYFVLRLWKEPERITFFLLAGLFLGLGLCAKKTTLFILPVALVLLACLILRAGARRSLVVRNSLAFIVVGAATSGWYFMRNWTLYGDPLGSAMEKQTLAALTWEPTLLSSYFLWSFWYILFGSFIGIFGWMQIKMPILIYGAYAALFTICCLGALLNSVGERKGREDKLWPALFILACLAGVVIYNLSFRQPQGRFLFPVLGPIAVLLTFGLQELVKRTSIHVGTKTCLALAGACFLVVDLIALWRIHAFYH